MEKMKIKFTNSSFILISLALLSILFIRVTRGLDMTDEMQYYGQIKGLIETGKLFSNDLFIQQSVYILFYPVFYLYHLAFDFEGLVFFGRLLMAGLSISVFLYTFYKLMKLRLSSLVAGLTSLSLTFAIPYHGIFALSYNTVSQLLWIIFMLKFFEWKQSNTRSWSIIIIITAFAHPPSAITMSLLVLSRLFFEGDVRTGAKAIFTLLVGALIALLIALYFATPSEYINSIIFSRGYGVGSAFFSNKLQLISLLTIYAIFGSCLLFVSRLCKLSFVFSSRLIIATFLVLYLMGLVGGEFNNKTLYILSGLSALAYVWLLLNNTKKNTKFYLQLNWFVLALLAYATTLGITSGNGISQGIGAFMVGLPILLGLTACSAPSKNFQSDRLKITCIFLVIILFMANWTRYPYRDFVWWKASKVIQNIPEFKFINLSLERVSFINSIQKNLGPLVRGKRTLIVSEYPGLYFVLGAHAETCMLFMHSLTSNMSENLLLSCLSKKTPEVVVDISSNNDIEVEKLRMKWVMYNNYFHRAVNCEVQITNFNSATKNNPDSLKYTACFQTL